MCGGWPRLRAAARWGGLVVAGALAAALSLPAAAADIWVRSGADGDGSRENPYGALWKPLKSAVRGDVIHVAEGVYHGKGGSGSFVIRVPRLTLVGGYSADFSERDPFRHPTVLERASDFEGDWTGLPEAIVAGQQGADHRGLVLDGFVLDSTSRNAYLADGSLDPKRSWKGPLVETFSPNLVVRNCCLLNPYGEGVSSVFQGDGNEVGNSLVVNAFYAGISTRLAQPGSVVRIHDCTVAFTWFQPGRGGGTGVLVGRDGTTILDRNVVAFTQTDVGEAGCAVANPFGNDQTVLTDNVFYLCQGGLYRYMDADGHSRRVVDASGLESLNQEPADYSLAAASGNRESDPRLRPARAFFEQFSNLVAAAPGGLDLARVKQLRATLGLPYELAPFSPRPGRTAAYPRDQLAKSLVSRLEGRGFRPAGPFAEYHSESLSLPVVDPDRVDFEALTRGVPGLRALNGRPVSFRAALGAPATAWLLAAAPRQEYSCVKLVKPGEAETSPRFVYAYLRKGSEAAATWQRLYLLRGSVNAQGGVVAHGRAFAAGDETSPNRVAVVVDRISVP